MMLTRSVWLCGVAVALLLGSEALAQQGIRWRTNLQSAKREAAQTNRLVLVNFSAPWCTACRKMDREVFSQPGVIRAIEGNYVPVRLNVDHYPIQRRQFGVDSLPTDVVITPQEQLVDRRLGYAAPQVYIAHLNNVAARQRSQPAAGYAQQPGGVPRPGYSDGRYADPRSGQPRYQPAPRDPRYNDPALGSRGVIQHRSRGDIQHPMGTSQPPQAHYSPQRPAQPGRVAAQPGRVAAQPGRRSENPGAAYRTPYRTAADQHQPQQQSSTPPAIVPALPAGRQPPPTSRPSSATPPPIGLDGHCPVQLTEKKCWKLGDRRWGAIHRGRTYLFAGPEEQKRFLDSPDLYSPVISGNDVVLSVDQGKTMPGQRKHGVYYGNRIYLFASEASLETFRKRPGHYANAALRSVYASRGQAYR